MAAARPRPPTPVTLRSARGRLSGRLGAVVIGGPKPEPRLTQGQLARAKAKLQGAARGHTDLAALHRQQAASLEGAHEGELSDHGLDAAAHAAMAKAHEEAAAVHHGKVAALR